MLFPQELADGVQADLDLGGGHAECHAGEAIAQDDLIATTLIRTIDFMASIEDRIAALEAAVRQLTASDHAAKKVETTTAGGGDLWALEELERRHPDGAVTFAGHAEVSDGPVRWQWGADTGQLLEQEWDTAAEPLAALGHPVRLRLLQLVLAGHRTTAELADEATLGTTGQLHHHLRALTSADWLVSTGRGRYAVPPQRAIPLLTIVSATIS